MKSKSARLVRRNHARYHQGRDDLNIVPMIDMMVILVFFLIFTAVFSKTNILQLNLPASATFRSGGSAERIEARSHHSSQRFGGQ